MGDWNQKKNFLRTPGQHVVTITQVIPKMSKTNFPQLQIEFRTDEGALISTWLTSKMVDKKTGATVENKKAMEKLAKLKMVCGLGPTSKAPELINKRLIITAIVEFLGVSDFSAAAAGAVSPSFDDFNNPTTPPPNSPDSGDTIPW